MHERGGKRQLRRGEREGLARERLLDAVHLVEHLARRDLGNPVLGVALAVAHAHLGRLLRYRLVGEDADPDAAAALDVTRHRAARRLDLARGETTARGRLEPVFAEAHLVADGRNALVAALLLFTVLTPGWLQHSSLLVLRPLPRRPGSGVADASVPGRAPAPAPARRCAP